jgi:hypothetical protein
MLEIKKNNLDENNDINRQVLEWYEHQTGKSIEEVEQIIKENNKPIILNSCPKCNHLVCLIHHKNTQTFDSHYIECSHCLIRTNEYSSRDQLINYWQRDLS